MRISNDELTVNKVKPSHSPIDMSVAFNSDPIWLGHISNYAIQLFFTGTPTGTLKLQASLDKGNPTKGESHWDLGSIKNWTDLDCSSQGVSASGDHMWQVDNAGYNWVRVVWTPAGGTGTLDSARFNAKGI